MNKKVFIVIGIILVVFGLLYLTYDPVSDEKLGDATTSNDLEGKTFYLIEYNGYSIKNGATINFSNGQISATFCNQTSGDYTINNGRLQSSLVGTQRGCLSGNIMEIEQNFSSLLHEGAKTTMHNGRLTITGNGIILVFTQN